MLIKGQRDGSHCGTSILNQCDLDGHSKKDDEKEEAIVKEALEDVVLFCS